MRVRKQILSQLAMAGFFCCWVALTAAADGYWKVADGDYGTGGNWDISHVPLWWESAIVTNGGTVRVSSGVYTNTTFQMFGSNELTNRLYMTGGEMVVRSNAQFGGNESKGSDGVAEFYLSGGTFKIETATKSMALGSGGSGYVEVFDHGVLDLSYAYTHIVGWNNPGGKGTGTINLKPGGTILVAQSSGAQGVIKINHATQAHFQCNGGTIRLTDETGVIFFGSSSGHIEMMPGGLIIDTGDFNGGMSYPIVGDETSGGLTKRGSGILQLTAANEYAGQTVVEAGTLVVKMPSALPGYDQAGRVVVKAGATIIPFPGDGMWTAEEIEILRANATIEPGGSIASLDEKVFDIAEDTVDATSYSVSKAVKTGPGMLTLTGHNYFGQQMVVSNGVLAADRGAGLSKLDYVLLSGGLLASPSGLIDTPLGTGAGHLSFADGTVSGFTSLDRDLEINFGGLGYDMAIAHTGTNPSVFVFNDSNATHNVVIRNHLYAGAWNSSAWVSFSVQGGSASVINGFCGTNNNSKISVKKLGRGSLTLGDTTIAKGKGTVVQTLYVEEGRLCFKGGPVSMLSENYHLVGSDSAESPAELLIDGADVVCAGGRFLAGDSPKAGSHVHGRLLVRSGRVTMTKAGAAFAAGNGGDGYVEVGGGDLPALVDCSTGYAVILPKWNDGPQEGVTRGEFRILKNGTVISKYGMYSKNATEKYATFVMDGGTFEATASCTDTNLSGDGFGFLRNIGNVYMGTSGGTIDTRANTLYAAQPFTAWTNQTAIACEESDYNTMPALVKKGSGVLRLAGANTYLCATAVDEGKLTLASGATIPVTPLRLGASGTFDLGGTSQTVTHLLGSGVVRNGMLTATGDIFPGGVGTIGMLTVGEGCALAKPTGRLVIDATGTVCDKLVLSGALDVSGLDLVIHDRGLEKGTGAYDFIEAAGGLTGQFKSVASDTGRWTAVISGGKAQLVKVGLVLLFR